MTRVGEGGGGGCSLDTQRIMAESECRVDEVTGGSESSELDYSLDLFFEEEEVPAIPEGPSDNNGVEAFLYCQLEGAVGDETVTLACQQSTDIFF